MMKIDDGKGSGRQAGVNSLQQLETNNLPDEVRLVVDGDVYNYNSGTVTLTSANLSGVLYLKNLGPRDLLITSFIYLLGTSTGGSGDTLVQIYKDPTTGTLVSAGAAAVPANRNFGSDATLDVTALNGAEGRTITDGTVAIESIFSAAGRFVVSVSVVLPRGKALAVAITPPSGNTSMPCQFALPILRLSDPS